MSVRRLSLTAGLITGVVLVVFGLREQATSSTNAAVQHSHLHASQEIFASAIITPVTTESSAALLADLNTTSLAGVDIPRSLVTDAQGNLIVDEGLRELMDFFLSLEGEREFDEIRTLYYAAAQQQCDANCAATAIALLDDYRHYLSEMQSQQQILSDIDDLRARMEAVTALRAQLLGPALADALFGYEQAYDALRIEQWEIQQDNQLPEQAKQEQLQALTFSSPDGLQERDAAAQQWRQLRTLQRESTQQDQASLYSARLELVGETAASRLAELDTARQQWQQRYQQYRSEAAIIDSTALAASDRAEQLVRLRQEYFSAQEITRVAALDRIQARSQP